MQQVQKELEIMKKKTNECEFIIKKDERVRKLQSQISWFRDEALFLSEEIKTMKNQVKVYKEKCIGLENDKKNLLDLQCKETKKTQVLRSALKKSQ
jgi:hypothetical protein